MKKRITLVLFIVIILIIITLLFVFLGKKIKNENTMKAFKEELTSIGYNSQEIETIKDKLGQTGMNILLEYEYIDNLTDVINNPEFKKEYIHNYLELMASNTLNTDDIMYIINNNFYSSNVTYDENVMKLVKGKYSIGDNIERYINYYNKNSKLSIDKIISNVNANLDYDYYTNTSNVDLSKGILVLVNKYYKLDSSYVPDNLVTIDSRYGNNRKMQRDAYEAFKIMFEAATKEGLNFYAASPYRSYSYQQILYSNYVKSDGRNTADTYSARPGYSEHQTGLAVDLMTRNIKELSQFGSTKEYKWLMENAHKYGFILRYPKDKEDITGYIYEPWHYRYLGIDTATKVYESGLTYDEYYAYYIR